MNRKIRTLKVESLLLVIFHSCSSENEIPSKVDIAIVFLIYRSDIRPVER